MMLEPDLEIMYQQYPQYVRFANSWLDFYDAVDDFIDSIPAPFAYFIP
jgi:hypothetical protein